VFFYILGVGVEPLGLGVGDNQGVEVFVEV